MDHTLLQHVERVGYQIPAICYSIHVTMSPRFKRLLPIVQNVPRLPIANSEASNSQSPKLAAPLHPI